MINENLLNSLVKDSLYFTVEELIKKMNISSSEEAKALIAKLKKEKKIQTIYRIKTNEIFLDYENDWTPHLQELCKVFKTTKGNYIDGSEFSNIEYKFKFLLS